MCQLAVARRGVKASISIWRARAGRTTVWRRRETTGVPFTIATYCLRVIKADDSVEIHYIGITVRS